MNVRAAVDRAFEIGMFQHRQEILGLAEFVAALKPVNILEIGGLHGGTAALWHSLCSGRVVSIDLPDGEFGGAAHHYNTARCEERNAKLAAEFPRFRGVLGNSHDQETFLAANRALDGASVDFLFIDGDHSLAGVTKDWLGYRALVRYGGWIGFHDINDTKWHRETGCRVDMLWETLKGRPEAREFNIRGPWGGIGVVQKVVDRDRSI